MDSAGPSRWKLIGAAPAAAEESSRQSMKGLKEALGKAHVQWI